jgi:hypothetical protein
MVGLYDGWSRYDGTRAGAMRAALGRIADSSRASRDTSEMTARLLAGSPVPPA